MALPGAEARVWGAGEGTVRYRLLVTLGVLVVASAAALLVAVARGRRYRPNVIFICVDTLRGDHVHAAGYPRDTTPNLDALIRRSVYFRRAYSQYTSTWLSVGSYFSSRHPHDFYDGTARYHLRSARPPTFIVPPQFPVMPEYFHRRGYYTVAVTANPNLTAEYGYARGFDELHVMSGDPRDPEGLTQYARADKLNEAVLERYEAVMRQKQPFFLYLHYMDPHMPYLAPEPFKGRYRKGLKKSPRLDAANVPAGRGYEYYATLTDEDVAYMTACHDEEIRYFDDRFGRLLAAFEERGALDDTVLILTADHGEQFLEHGLFGHDNACHVEEVHVPLLIHGKRFKPRMVDRPVGLISLWPTLAELIEDDPQALRYAQGVSILPELEGRARPRAGAASAEPRVISEGKGSISLRTDRYSYVLYSNPQHVFPVGAWRPGQVDPPEVWHRLYRIDRDPDERNDLFASDRETVARLHFALATKAAPAVSRDYWFGEDDLAPWFGGSRGDLDNALEISTDGALQCRLTRPQGADHFSLRAANSSDQPGVVRLRITTQANSWYYLAAAYSVAPHRAVGFETYDGPDRIFDETTAPDRSTGRGLWRRALPINTGQATLALTVPPRAAVRVDELYAIQLHFLKPGPKGPRRGLSDQSRERLRGLGYME